MENKTRMIPKGERQGEKEDRIVSSKTALSLRSPRAFFASVSHSQRRSLQMLSLVPRAIHSIRVRKGGLKASATSANFLTSLTGDVPSKIAEDDWRRSCTLLHF